MKNKVIPKLRFKGFHGKWKNNKLKNLAQFINGKAFKQRDLLNKGKYPVIRVGNFYTDKKIYYSNKELPNKYYLNNKDLLYTWSATFGPHIWHGGKVIYHYHIWKIICKSVYKYFLLQLLNIDKNHIQKNGSTMAHITKYGMETKKITIPSLPEQQLIGKFFAKLDKLIQLQQKKVSLLKKLRQGYLQKLFPREGKAMPRLRFKGFHDKWHHTQLQNVINLRSGGSFKPRDRTKNGIQLIRVQNVTNNKRSNKNSRPVYYKNLPKYDKYQLHYGNIIMALSGSTGAVSIIQHHGKYYQNQRVEYLKPNLSDISNNFLYYLLQSQQVQNQVKQYKTQSAQSNLSVKDLSKFMVYIPDLFEQKQISHFFKLLDTKIQYQQQKLHQLRVLKQGYLQNMFC